MCTHTHTQSFMCSRNGAMKIGREFNSLPHEFNKFSAHVELKTRSLCITGPVFEKYAIKKDTNVYIYHYAPRGKPCESPLIETIKLSSLNDAVPTLGILITTRARNYWNYVKISCDPSNNKAVVIN